MKRIVTEYINVLENIGNAISNSPYKTSYIIDKMGMKPNTFHSKVRNKNFSPYELMELMQIIDIQDKLEKEEILLSLQEAKNGNVRPHKDVMADARKRVEKWR